MHPTPYPDINALLERLLSGIRAILGPRLAGLYLYGSLVTGDFDPEISDVDLLAVTAGDLTEAEVAALKGMHDDVASATPRWAGRIEVAYLSVTALQTFKKQTGPIAVISPGEPFHMKTAGRDWLLNWYVVREKGVTLFGPPPQTLIAPISKAEFIQAVQEQTAAWRGYIIEGRESRPFQAYAILTLCRALYAYQNGEQVSKQQAAHWAQGYLPQWAELIQKALAWRVAWREQTVDPAATFPETVRFVQFVIARIVG